MAWASIQKWISIQETPSHRVTRRFEVRSNDGNVMLGEVRFFPRWRKYAFYPESSTLYEQDCLRDIADFCEYVTKQWREELKNRPKPTAPPSP